MQLIVKILFMGALAACLPSSLAMRKVRGRIHNPISERNFNVTDEPPAGPVPMVLEALAAQDGRSQTAAEKMNVVVESIWETYISEHVRRILDLQSRVQGT